MGTWPCPLTILRLNGKIAELGMYLKGWTGMKIIYYYIWSCMVSRRQHGMLFLLSSEQGLPATSAQNLSKS